MEKARGSSLRVHFDSLGHSVVLSLGESEITRWPVRSGELPNGGAEPKWKIEAFAAKRLGELFEKLERLEE